MFTVRLHLNCFQYVPGSTPIILLNACVKAASTSGRRHRLHDRLALLHTSGLAHDQDHVAGRDNSQFLEVLGEGRAR